MVAQFADHVLDIRTPGILGYRVDGDYNVLCILTSAQALDRKNFQ